MAHAYYHAKSSARRFGGTLEDYLRLHEWMDHTKGHLADARHRLVLHNSWGIFLAEAVLGKTLVRATDGREIPTRPIFEQHVIEDLGFIPTLEQCMGSAKIEVAPWMYRRASPLSTRKDSISPMQQVQLTREQIMTLATEYNQLADWTTIRDFCNQVYGPGKASRAEIEIDAEYNDEGGYDYSVSYLSAYDADGNTLKFDLGLPFWQQFEDLQAELKKHREAYTPELVTELERIREERRKTPYEQRALRDSLYKQEQEILGSFGNPKDEEEIQEMAKDAMHNWYPYGEKEKAAKAAGYVQWEELPAIFAGQTKFDLTQPPALSFPTIYAPA